MPDPGVDEIVAAVSQREPDFYGRHNAPIWCWGEPSILDIKALLHAEGTLVPNSQRMREFMDRAWNART